jgi:hypothetical protein
MMSDGLSNLTVVLALETPGSAASLLSPSEHDDSGIAAIARRVQSLHGARIEEILPYIPVVEDALRLFSIRGLNRVDQSQVVSLAAMDDRLLAVSAIGMVEAETPIMSEGVK